MIERIYIPTICRADTQITFQNLPDELQERVIMVVQSSERHLYKYNCQYLEIPNKIAGSWTQLTQTRKFIHKHAGNIKYAMIDDDLILYKRNSKYFGHSSDMKTSKRKATSKEILTIFNTASTWLDEKNIGIAGVSNSGNPPIKEKFSDTIGVFSFLFLDGKKISKIIDEFDTGIRVSEDTYFIFLCLSKGINTRVSNEFLADNRSHYKELKGKRPIWEEIYILEKNKHQLQTKEHIDALKYINKKFPGSLTIRKNNGTVKCTRHWKKVYTSNL